MIESPNSVTKTYIRWKKLRKQVFYTKVYLKKEKLEIERIEIEKFEKKYPLEANEVNKACQDSEILKDL